MQNDANCNTSTTASVYRNGLRASVKVSSFLRTEVHVLPENVVFCEGALAGVLCKIYAAESESTADCTALISSAWYAPKELRAAPEGFSISPAQRGDKGVIRGIYALSAQSIDCFVRKFRAEWDALWQAWSESGMTAWLISNSEKRVCAYIVIGKSASGAAADDALYEFCALPDCALSAEHALSLAIASGALASDARIHVSQLHFSGAQV